MFSVTGCWREETEMPIKLRAAALTDVGRVRDKNEDTVFRKVFDAPDDDPIGLFVVADGIGGRLAGQLASYWAVEVIKNSLSDLIAYRDSRATKTFSREEVLRPRAAAATRVDPSSLKERVTTAVDKANGVVRGYARHRPEDARDAGTTLCLALVYGLQAVVANVGDSRAYVLRDGWLHQITKDHSVVQRMIDAGQVRADALYTHPQRHLIYRSLGARDTVKPDIFTLTLASGDCLLLCTDGLWEMIQDANTIVSIISTAASVQTACQQLVAAANAAGGQDNIGVVLAQVYE
jgi:serine/threonine protein phosphatase PrpC